MKTSMYIGHADHYLVRPRDTVQDEPDASAAITGAKVSQNWDQNVLRTL